MKKLVMFAALASAALTLSACGGGNAAVSDSVTMSRADYDALRVEASGIPVATVQSAKIDAKPLASLEPKKMPVVKKAAAKKADRNSEEGSPATYTRTAEEADSGNFDNPF